MYPKKAPNHNKSNKSPRKKDEDLNKNLEKGKRKDGKLFARSIIIVYSEINMITINNSSFSSPTQSLTLSIALVVYKNSWYYNTKATNYLYNRRNTFTSHTEFNIPQSIEDIGRSIMFWGINMVRLNIQLINQSIMPINLRDIY